jgi:hypothetical protein
MATSRPAPIIKKYVDSVASSDKPGDTAVIDENSIFDLCARANQ